MLLDPHLIYAIEAVLHALDGMILPVLDVLGLEYLKKRRRGGKGKWSMSKGPIDAYVPYIDSPYTILGRASPPRTLPPWRDFVIRSEHPCMYMPWYVVSYLTEGTLAFLGHKTILPHGPSRRSCVPSFLPPETASAHAALLRQVSVDDLWARSTEGYSPPAIQLRDNQSSHRLSPEALTTDMADVT